MSVYKDKLKTLRKLRRDINNQHSIEQDNDDPNEEVTVKKLEDMDKKIAHHKKCLKEIKQ